MGDIAGAASQLCSQGEGRWLLPKAHLQAWTSAGGAAYSEPHAPAEREGVSLTG